MHIWLWRLQCTYKCIMMHRAWVNRQWGRHQSDTQIQSLQDVPQGADAHGRCQQALKDGYRLVQHLALSAVQWSVANYPDSAMIAGSSCKGHSEGMLMMHGCCSITAACWQLTGLSRSHEDTSHLPLSGLSECWRQSPAAAVHAFSLDASAHTDAWQ